METKTNIQSLNKAARTFTNELTQEFRTFGRALKVVNDSCKRGASSTLKAAGIAFFGEIGIEPGKLTANDIYHNAAGCICILARAGKKIKKVTRAYVSTTGETIKYVEQCEVVCDATGHGWAIIPLDSYSFAKVIAAAKSAKVFAKVAADVELKEEKKAARAAAKQASKQAKQASKEEKKAARAYSMKVADLFAELKAQGLPMEEIARRMCEVA